MYSQFVCLCDVSVRVCVCVRARSMEIHDFFSFYKSDLM